MYIFGGQYYPKQISVVDGCKVRKLRSKLDFDMNAGACAQRHNAEIFICFYREDWTGEDEYGHGAYENCQRATGPLEKFSRLPNSTFEHNDARIAVTSGKPYCIRNFDESENGSDSYSIFRLHDRCWK